MRPKPTHPSMDESRIKKLGPPDLKVSGFQFWVHGRDFPDAQDYYDGNWLKMTAYCGPDAGVTGSYVCVMEIQGWLKTCEALAENLKGTAGLECLEPELDVHMEAKSHGRIEMEVTISHQPYDQPQKSSYELEQTDLTVLIQNLKTIVEKYPVRGTPEDG